MNETWTMYVNYERLIFKNDSNVGANESNVTRILDGVATNVHSKPHLSIAISIGKGLLLHNRYNSESLCCWKQWICFKTCNNKGNLFGSSMSIRSKLFMQNPLNFDLNSWASEVRQGIKNASEIKIWKVWASEIVAKMCLTKFLVYWDSESSLHQRCSQDFGSGWQQCFLFKTLTMLSILRRAGRKLSTSWVRAWFSHILIREYSSTLIATWGN